MNTEDLDILRYVERLARTPQILVVDDDSYIRLVFSTFSQQYDVDVFFAPSGEEATEILLDKRYNIDIVFLDMELETSVSGMDVLRFINQKNMNVHVIIMSGSINLGDVMEEANRLGVVSFIKKPIQFNADYLLKVCARLRVKLVPRGNLVVSPEI